VFLLQISNRQVQKICLKTALIIFNSLKNKIIKTDFISLHLLFCQTVDKTRFHKWSSVILLVMHKWDLLMVSAGA